jgi:hypothetical protein
MADSRFLSFLYSPRLMNSPGPGQQSVFSMLERLQSPMARNHELPPEDGPNGDDGEDGHGMEVVEDGSSLMLCSPLIPQRDSLVEIAETEYVSFNEAGRVVAESHRSPLYQAHTIDDIDEETETEGGERKSGTHQATADGDKDEGSSAEDKAADGEDQPGDASGTESSIFRWPWFKTEGEKRVEQQKKLAEAKAKEEQKLKKRNEKLMWVPSPTKISLQTMWWGYRMSVNFQMGGFWLIDCPS